ncbi:MAG TPA: hypothetical protein VI731_09380 [Bacteroidia bacterium]|nr:hypothetical protein [Bacteroidia bacterium]
MRTTKIKRVISIISDMDEARLDALLLLLQQPVGDDYVLDDEDKMILNERMVNYEKGIEKGTPARTLTKQIRNKLKKLRK